MTQQVVWHADDSERRYAVRVVRIGRRTGEWQFVRMSDGEIVKRRPVILSFGAVFGPDIADAQQWLLMAYGALAEFEGEGHG